MIQEGKMKKILCAILVLILALGCCAEASRVGTLYDAARKLAFATSNVTLKGEASFYYDADLFKVMHASYEQDGQRSYLSYMLDTLHWDGTTTTGGYTVLGLGTESYAYDTFYGPYYTQHYNQLCETVLKSNERTEKLLNLGKGLALLGEDFLDVNEQNGNEYHFVLSDLPSVIDDGVYYLVLDYIMDNYYVDYFGIYDNGSKTQVFYEDWYDVFDMTYSRIYGDDPEDVDEQTRSDRYDMVTNLMDQQERELRKQYPERVIYVRADGSVESYASELEYMRAFDLMYLQYQDYEKALKDYYEVIYGEILTEETLLSVYISPNQELWQAFLDFVNGMDRYYSDLALKADPEAIGCVVKTDGSLKTYTYPIYNNLTVTQAIFDNLSYAELAGLDAKVTTDGEGRLTGFNGSALITVTDTDGRKHELKIEYDLSADNYGTTQVPAQFVPEDYGLMSYDEYYQQAEQADPEEYEQEYEAGEDDDMVLPEKVMFAGAEYETLLTDD